MEVENRHIKKEEPTNNPSTGGGARDSNLRGEPVEEDDPRIHLQEDQHCPKTTVYSLNMNVCRLCLSEGHGHLQPVYYAQDSPDEILQQKILALTTVEITYATDFPMGVCMECLAKLDDFSLFRRQCIENNEILKLKYYELKTESDGDGFCKQEHTADHYHPADDRTVQLARVKKEEEFIELDGSSTVVQRNGEPGPFVDDGTGNAIPVREEVFVGSEQPVVGTKIQYMAEDGTMTEYITQGAIVRRAGGAGNSSDLEEPPEGHEIYYAVGGDSYAIPAEVEAGYGNAGAANFGPPEFENQTEIECTTIENHLPEEYVDEGPPVMVASTVGPSLTLSRGRNDRPFVCKHCKTSFKYEHNYDRHMKNHAKVLYRCGKCSKTFVKLRKCQQHYRKAHSSQRYECDICFRTYSLPTRLENHVIEMHSVNGVYRCDRCQGELFTTYLDFKAHRLQFHPRNDDAAGDGSSVGLELTPAIIKQTPYGDEVHMEHVLAANGSRSPSGSPASSTDSDERPVTRSKRRSAIRTVPSGLATVVASTTGGVQRTTRLRTYGRASGRQQRSPASAATLHAQQQQQQQQQHDIILIDDDEQQQQRNIANGTDAPVVHRELLQQIEESEANSIGPKMYTCVSCPKTFVHLNNLKAHIYAEHDNDKPFKCKLCPISFKTKEILVMHMLLHTQNNSAT